jgi:hypothetical protein
VAGHQDRGQLHVAVPQLVQGVEAGDPRQSFIDQQAGVAVRQVAQQKGLAGTAAHHVEPLELERELKRRPDRRIVIDDHDKRGREIGRIEHASSLPFRDTIGFDRAQIG